MKSKNLILVAALLLGGAAPYVIVSCVTRATQQEQSQAQAELGQAKKDSAADPENAVLKLRVAELTERLAAIEAKAQVERADSKHAILEGSAIALEGLSPLLTLFVPAGGVGLAAIAGLLRRFS